MAISGSVLNRLEEIADNCDCYPFGKLQPSRLPAGRGEELRKACLKLGGKPAAVGDVSSILPLFDFFPVMVQFWDADEEYDAVLKIMWDKNATDFMHFETIAFATGHLIERLKECMEEDADAGMN